MVFGTVSVVMMAAAARPLPSGDRVSFGRFFSRASMFSRWPITPVEQTITSFSSIPRREAQAFPSRLAFSGPSGAQALITAWARPSARWAFVTWMGAACTRFLVYTAAAAQGTSDQITAVSSFSEDALIPQRTAPA